MTWKAAAPDTIEAAVSGLLGTCWERLAVKGDVVTFDDTAPDRIGAAISGSQGRV